MRTEAVILAAQGGAFSLDNSENPEFIGRAVAALACEPKLMERTGKVLVTAAPAEELGVIELEGRQPKPLKIGFLNETRQRQELWPQTGWHYLRMT